MGNTLNLQQVVALLRDGDVKALQNVPKGLFMQATAELAKAGRAKSIGVTVYEKSGSIGITGIRTRPIVAYKSEWDAITAFMATDKWQAAMDDPLASSGSDDPRYEAFRKAAKEKRDQERKALAG